MDLIKAVSANDLERVRLLVEQGADKDQGGGDGCTSGGRLVAATFSKKGESLDKANKYGWTPLIIAAAKGHLELTRYLLEQGADRDKATSYGYTPLHKAAYEGRLEIAMLLMSYGADLNAKNNNGKLPIEVGYRITEEIKQAIRNEPRRRMDEAPGKRATEQDRHPNTSISASAQHEEEEEEEPMSKHHLLDEGAVAEEVETKVAEEDEDSEPSSDEDDS